MKKPRQTSTPAGADKLPTQSVGSTLVKGAQRNFVVSNLQQEPSNDNIQFIGNVGRFVRSQTDGISVDVTYNGSDATVWYRVLPIHPEILQNLRVGDRVQVSGKILSAGRRPLIRGFVRLIESRRRPVAQLPLWRAD